MMFPYIIALMIVLVFISPSFIVLNMGYTSEGSRLRTFFTLFDILFEGLGEDALNDVIKHLGGGIYPDGLELEGGEDQELDVGASDKVRQITDVILYIYIFIACPMILVNMVIGYVIECKDALNETIKDHRVDMMVSRGGAAYLYLISILIWPHFDTYPYIQGESKKSGISKNFKLL